MSMFFNSTLQVIGGIAALAVGAFGLGLGASSGWRTGMELGDWLFGDTADKIAAVHGKLANLDHEPGTGKSRTKV